MKKAFLSFAILAMILISSCTKPEVGATGPQGATGAAGTNGTNGTNGVNGNANVIGTATVALTSSNWFLSSNSQYYYSTLTTTVITQAIVDKGAVMVYEQSGTSWRALPYTSGIVSKFFTFSLNTVNVFYQNTDASTTANPGNQTYRIVAISSSVAAANPNVNWGNYEEVMKILN
jgi:hypothetical protein